MDLPAPPSLTLLPPVLLTSAQPVERGSLGTVLQLNEVSLLAPLSAVMPLVVTQLP